MPAWKGILSRAVGEDNFVIVSPKLNRYYRSILFKLASAKLTNRYDPTIRFVPSNGSIRRVFKSMKYRARMLSPPWIFH